MFERDAAGQNPDLGPTAGTTGRERRNAYLEARRTRLAAEGAERRQQRFRACRARLTAHIPVWPGASAGIGTAARNGSKSG